MNNACHPQLNPKAATSGLLAGATGMGKTANTCQGSTRLGSAPITPRQLSHISWQPLPPLTDFLGYEIGTGLSLHVGWDHAGTVP